MISYELHLGILLFCFQNQVLLLYIYIVMVFSKTFLKWYCQKWDRISLTLQ